MSNIEILSKIVVAYVSQNKVSTRDLPVLINDLSSKLKQLPAHKIKQGKQKPAVPIKESITDNYLICLEDGLRFKSMKRHLRTRYGLTPAEYQRKWGLPEDYPMVAPSYSKKRSRLAKDAGLGRKS